MKYLCVMIAAALLLGGCKRTDDANLIVGTLERDRLELIAESNEPLLEISVREGDAVEAGRSLVRQGDGPIQARLAQLSAAVTVADRKLAQLIKGPRAQEIAEARAAREATQSELLTQSREYQRVSDLVERKLVSQSALDQARALRDAAASAQKQSDSRLSLLLEGTRREEIEQADASLRQAQAALAEVQLSADRYILVAPRAGRIEAIPYKLGERPPAGAPLIVMLADGMPFARVYVPEPRRTEYASGKTVSVRIDGYEQAFKGVVRFISAEAAFTPYFALTQRDRTRLSYLAEIDLTDTAANDLPTGIPVQIDAAGK